MISYLGGAMMRVLLISLFLFAGAASVPAPPGAAGSSEAPYVVVLGIAQDAGYPQAGCARPCCVRPRKDPRLRRMASCIAVVDPASGERWIFDATPDMREQLALLDSIHPPANSPGIAGIFLTHGHIGHYIGLMHLGREAMGATGIPVYAMPRMDAFLRGNGPWSLLVELGNIRVVTMKADSAIRLNSRITVTPFTVPHRDEFTETVGFRITGPSGTAIYIPDIDKWQVWDRSITELLSNSRHAFLDGTFFAGGEIPGRDMSEIPHPFIEESLALFRNLAPAEKAGIRFIHFNHTNPLLDPGAEARRKVLQAGFGLAEEGERYGL